MKWIEIKEIPNPKRKTKAFAVHTNYDEKELLGMIRWFAGWRKYCFFPIHQTFYEWSCLRDIAEFIESETKKYKNENWVDKI